jgi:predicted ester cyclase
MSKDAHKAVVREFFHAIDGGNLERVQQLLAPGFQLHLPALAAPWGVEELLNDIREFYAAFPDATHAIAAFVAEGDLVAVRVNVLGTHRGEYQGIASTGRPVKVAGTHVVRINNGKIAEFWALEDMLHLMQQLGAEPVANKVQ